MCIRDRLILCIAAAYLLRVLDYLQQRKKAEKAQPPPQD